MSRASLVCLAAALLFGFWLYNGLSPDQKHFAILIPVSALGCFLLIRTVIAAREGIAASVSALVVFAVVVFVAFKALPEPSEPKRLGIACIAGLIAYGLMPGHQRRLRANVKNDVIRNYERRTGKRYNSRKHHIDHIWPFALGGSNTEDNLRVITKAENLRKGRRKPRVKDWL